MEDSGFESFDFPIESSFEFDTTSLNLDFFNLSDPIMDLVSNNNVLTATAIPQEQHNSVTINNSNDFFGLQQHVNDPFAQQHLVQNNGFSIGGGGTTNFEVGGSSMQGQNQNQNQNQNYNETMPLLIWPPKPNPFLCSCCHVLREIIHSNGTYFEKLEIHGTLGAITHAIHHHNIPVDGSSNNVQFEMIDLCCKNIEEIKSMIQGYCGKQISAGYFMVQDPLSSYYEALCTGMEWIEDVNDDLNADELEQEAECNNASNDGTAAKKPTLSQQRERAARTKLSDMSDYFHLPIRKASKKLGLSPTVVKKICRKEGLKRWPHRKVKSIARQIEIMRRALGVTVDPFSRMRAEAEIHRLHRYMTQSCAGVAPTAIDYDQIMKEAVPATSK